MNLLLFGAIAAFLVIYISCLNWRNSVKIALVLLVLEGALRKWLFPQASILIYFLKDFILIGAYIGYFFLTPRKINLVNKDQTIKFFAVMATFWCVFQAFNPSLGSPIIGFFGIKNYLLYIPLMWLIPALFTSTEQLYQFLRSYLLLLIPVGLLAIVQFFSPTDSILNVYSDEAHQIAVFGGENIAVRVTGTFSYIAGYSIYLGISLALLLPILSAHQSRLWRWLTIAEILLIAITSFMTGSRGLVGAEILMLLAYFGIQALTQFPDFLRNFQKLFLPATLAFVAVTIGFNSAVQAFWARVTANSDIAQRIIGGFSESFAFFVFKGVDGYGTGATFQGNTAIRNLLNLPGGEFIPTYYEGEVGRIALELGPIGFFIWYTLKFILLLALGSLYFRLQRPFLRNLALSAFICQALSFSNQLVFNHTAGLYHWFFNGFIFLLPQLEHIANWQDSQQYLPINFWQKPEKKEQGTSKSG